MKFLLYSFLVVPVLLLGPLYMAAYGSEEPRGGGWRTASRESARIAPLPQDAPEAIIQVYAARTYSWRGHLAVHTWIATKAEGADHYLMHHVMGFRARRGLPIVVSEPDIPDRHWYGNRPELLLDLRGEQAAALLPNVLEAVEDYPYPREYRLWPGPNSNTFTAFVARRVPELGLDLPVTAIGKDYLPGGAVLGRPPSGSGLQFSLLGAFGVILSKEEGFEMNVLGLSFGVDFLKPALKFPGIGRIGSQQSIPLRPDDQAVKPE